MPANTHIISRSQNSHELTTLPHRKHSLVSVDHEGILSLWDGFHLFSSAQICQPIQFNVYGDDIVNCSLEIGSNCAVIGHYDSYDSKITFFDVICAFRVHQTVYYSRMICWSLVIMITRFDRGND